MKNISRKTNGFQKSEANRTIERINRLRAAFSAIKPGNQQKFIELLSVEIEAVEDAAVKSWLIKFRAILEAVSQKEVAANV